jgi:hypothetical protein
MVKCDCDLQVRCTYLVLLRYSCKLIYSIYISVHSDEEDKDLITILKCILDTYTL